MEKLLLPDKKIHSISKFAALLVFLGMLPDNWQYRFGDSTFFAASLSIATKLIIFKVKGEVSVRPGIEVKGRPFK